ncbi:ABC transporter permease [Bacillus litorisediminis]|uniref:ABC transporter permease n=1 Tax=Bacillus litorisediminis TaxID=2922713 RepID=UPI001FAD738B|nr:ABC transporter permease [Bacillus litorisediminis]
MRIAALIKRICLQMFREKRTLGLLFVAPLLILSLMYLLFNGEAVDSKLGVANIEESLIGTLEDADIVIKQYDSISEASKLVVSEDLDGFLAMDNGNFILTLQNSDPTSARAIQMKINQVIGAEAQAQLVNQIGGHVDIPQVNIETEYVYGNSETGFFDVLSPILVGFFVFFFVFLISGIGLLKERTTGTLERLMSTPIRRGEIVASYLIGYGLFAVLQTFIVVLYSINVLDMILIGSIWNVIFINLLLALVALSLGTLLSAFAASEFQMVQFIPVVVIPQVFFSGIIPLEGMAEWLQALAKIMPIHYAADALKDVMYKGHGLKSISGDILALTVFAVIFIVCNIFALKRYRTL